MIFQETEKTELKKVYNDTIPKEIVAFLNTAGGTIYIGVGDNGEVLGVRNLDEVQKKIADAITTQILPNPQEYVEVGSKYIDGKNVAEITVAKGNALYYIKKYGRSAAGCFIRVGTSCRSMTEEQIEKGLLAYIRQDALTIVDTPCLKQDLSFHTLKTYLNNNGIHVNDRSFNVNYHLLTQEGKFNEMAFLLADENDISIKVAVFDGMDKTNFIKRNEYGGRCLLAAVDRVIDYFDAINDTYVEIGAHRRKEQKMFHLDAFKEAWINACVHNSWNKKTPPAVYVFDDRAEIVSTGSIPPSMTKEQFMAGESRPVNDELMRVFLACGMVEQSGHGVPIIVKEYGENAYKFEGDFIKVVIPFNKKGVRAPKTEKKNATVNGENATVKDKNATVNATVSENAGENATVNDENATVNATVNGENATVNGENATVNATVNGENATVKLNKTQKRILDILSAQPSATIEDLTAYLQLHRVTITRSIGALKAKGVIERIGSDKTGYWKIVK